MPRCLMPGQRQLIKRAESGSGTRQKGTKCTWDRRVALGAGDQGGQHRKAGSAPEDAGAGVGVGAVGGADRAPRQRLIGELDRGGVRAAAAQELEQGAS